MQSDVGDVESIQVGKVPWGQGESFPTQDKRNPLPRTHGCPRVRWSNKISAWTLYLDRTTKCKAMSVRPKTRPLILKYFFRIPPFMVHWLTCRMDSESLYLSVWKNRFISKKTTLCWPHSCYWPAPLTSSSPWLSTSESRRSGFPVEIYRR